MIRLYIHEKCFEQMFNLPKATQKKVVEFQKKFRDNPKSAAIHLEPISDFKDQSLQTARIDQKYRAVIKVPETGKDYYLLWVDNHDEAYDWARTKTFLWNEHTGTAQIFNAPIVNQTLTVPPIQHDETMLFQSYPNEKILALGVPQQCMALIRKIKNLDDLDKIEKEIPIDAFENLFYLADGANIDTLIREIQEGASNDPECINNKRSFIRVDESLLEEWLDGSFEKWQLFLHPSQRKLVENTFNGPVKVTGGGGTGKTVVALYRLKRLAAKGNSQKKILFTTFTHALTNNLASLIDRLQIPKNQFKLLNIDRLAMEHAEQIGLIDKSTRILDFPGSKKAIEAWEKILEDHLSSFDAYFLQQEYTEVWLYNNISDAQDYYHASRLGRGRVLSRKLKMEIAGLVEAYTNYKAQHQYMDRFELFNKLTDHFSTDIEKPYSHVIADEIQDFSNAELRFLRSLVENSTDDLFLVGDPYQKIYARQLNFSKAGINIRGNRSKRLRINYRTTEEIKRLAISTVRGFSYDDFDGAAETMDGYMSLMHGEKPGYQVFKTRTEELQHILMQVTELLKELRPNNIVIASRTKDAIKDIKTLLHNNHLPFYDLADKTGDPTGINLSTFHSLKGLEFKAVFLNNVYTITAPLVLGNWHDMTEEEKNEHLLHEKSLLYVAMTRAISYLSITGFGAKSELINI